MDREKLRAERKERKKLKRQQKLRKVINRIMPWGCVDVHDLELMHVYFIFAQEEQDSGNSKKGVIYVGHIPHGFFEQEMRAFFSQFGTVTRLRLARSKKVCS